MEKILSIETDVNSILNLSSNADDSVLLDIKNSSSNDQEDDLEFEALMKLTPDSIEDFELNDSDLAANSALVKQCAFVNGLLTRVYFVSLCIVEYFLPLSVLIVTHVIIAYYVYFINDAPTRKPSSCKKLLGVATVATVNARGLRSSSATTTSSVSNSNLLGKNKKKVNMSD